jgi:hypothetical protein
MRILVGTLYTIENEFEECCAAIRKQTYKSFDHLIIKDLPKKEAHDTLYQTFMDKSDIYDLLIKVDADMVLCSDKFFEGVVQKFTMDSQLDLFLIAVHDYFTDKLIMGLNIFRNTVRWRKNTNNLGTDMTYEPETIRKIEKDFQNLAPAAIHCKNSSPFQSFHFGFHRGIKALEDGTNWGILYSIVKNFMRSKNINVAYAILGANTAFSSMFNQNHIAYNNPALYEYFNRKFENLTENELFRFVKKSKMYYLYRLPIDRRVIYKYYQYKREIFRT